MSSPEFDALRDHEYDGIKEYDNLPPGWWWSLWFGSVVFSLVYILYYHASVLGWTIEDKWGFARDSYYERMFGELGTLEGDAGTIVEMSGDERWMALGKGIFLANCAQCHKADGSGSTGPNLTDEHWINVKHVEDLYRVVSSGVAAKGMPEWSSRLGQNQRVLVAAYVSTLRARPVVGKAAEGEPIAPWVAPEGQPRSGAH